MLGIHLSQRERKRHRVVCRAGILCASSPCCKSFYSERQTSTSKSTTNCVRGEICFKEIMSNTRLDLNHSSFTHLICEFLIICRFLFIYIQYLFIAFAYHIYLCCCLILDLCIVSFALSQK